MLDIQSLFLDKTKEGKNFPSQLILSRAEIEEILGKISKNAQNQDYFKKTEESKK